MRFEHQQRKEGGKAEPAEIASAPRPIRSMARRHPGSLELMPEIGALNKRGYTIAETAAKTDFTHDYIGAVCYLLEHGEERLLAAVERVPAHRSDLIR